MYEVEVKVPADVESVRDRLGSLDVTPVRAVEQVDTYYGAPHRDFATTDEALRLRRERPADGDPVTKLTYKGPLVEAESKTREEFESLVGDADEVERLLDRLGFEPAATVRKDRECYAVDGYTVTLDRVADVGDYVEVEREAAEGDVDAVRDGAFEVLEELGLDPDVQVRTSYLGLLLDET